MFGNPGLPYGRFLQLWLPSTIMFGQANRPASLIGTIRERKPSGIDSLDA